MDKKPTLPSTSVRSPKIYYGYIVVLAGFFIIFINSGLLNSYGIFFKPLSEEFAWSREMTSGAQSLSIFITGLLSIFAGRLCDRFGPRVISIVCGCLMALGCFLMSQTNASWQLYIFWGVIIGFGRSGGQVPIISTVTKWFHQKKGLMTGIVTSGVGMGQIIIPPTATQFISIYGWRISYIILGIVVLAVVAVASRLLRNAPVQAEQLPPSESSIKQENRLQVKDNDFSLREAMGTRQCWLLCLSFFCFALSCQAIIVHIVPHATDLGISAGSAASIVSVLGVFSILGRISMGNAGDRIGNKRALIIVFILAIFGLFWLQFAKELWMFYLFAVLFGFAWGGEWAQSAPIVANLFGIRAHGVILGLVFFSTTTGSAVGPILLGRIFDLTNSYGVNP